jgi:hypothetical protein
MVAGIVRLFEPDEGLVHRKREQEHAQTSQSHRPARAPVLRASIVMVDGTFRKIQPRRTLRCST